MTAHPFEHKDLQPTLGEQLAKVIADDIERRFKPYDRIDGLTPEALLPTAEIVRRYLRERVL